MIETGGYYIPSEGTLGLCRRHGVREPTKVLMQGRPAMMRRVRSQS
jgi:hypothetical protein